MDIWDNAAESRYETTVDGHRCVLDYRMQAGVMVIEHVGVPNEVGGRGIAAALAAAALDAARREGMRVIARCSYVAAYIERNPQYEDLLHV